MTEHVIDFNTDGGVESLYSNDVDIGHLGKQTMTRASHVLFNEGTQLWDVEPVGYNKADLPMQYSGFATYKDAVDFEIAIFNEARKTDMLDKLCTSDGILLATKVLMKIQFSKL